jgi:hypothetical protein
MFELKRMPRWMLDRLADALNAVEKSCEEFGYLFKEGDDAGVDFWDESAFRAWIALIQKSEESVDPKKQRPVVLLSAVIGVWGSMRSRQLLAQAAELAPSSLKGGLPDREASDVYLAIATRVEASKACGIPSYGVVFDLVKAFNRVPRRPVWEACQWIGLPSGFAGAWSLGEGMSSTSNERSDFTPLWGKVSEARVAFQKAAGSAYSQCCLLLGAAVATPWQPWTTSLAISMTPHPLTMCRYLLTISKHPLGMSCAA